MMKYFFQFMICCLILSSCAALPQKHDGIIQLNKNNLQQIGGLYHNRSIGGTGHKGTLTALFDLDTDPPEFCNNCDIRIDGIKNNCFNITVIGVNNKTATFAGKFKRRGFVNSRFKWVVAWGPFDGYGFFKTRLYLTKDGDLIVEETNFAAAGLLIFPFMIDGSKNTGCRFANVKND